MAQVKFYSGTKSQIDSKQIENGALYLSTDTKSLYIDLNDIRYEISGGSSSVGEEGIVRLTQSVEDTTNTISLPSNFVGVNNITIYHNGILLVEGLHYNIESDLISLNGYYAFKGDTFDFIANTKDVEIISTNILAENVLVSGDYQENKTVEAVLNSFNVDIENLKDNVENLPQQIETINSSIANINEGIQGLQTDASSLESSIQSIESDISSAQNSLGTKVSSIILNGTTYTPENGVVTLLTNVMQTNVAQTMTAKLVAKSGTDYTAKQVRNIIISTSEPSGGSNGDIWFVREA